MQIFSLCLAFSCAASFTSSLENSQPLDAFANYEGNRENLVTILKLFGPASDSFNRSAMTLDELISDEVIISALLPFKSLTINLHKLGGLLSDLSPVRFDYLCTLLDALGFEVTEMVHGYMPKKAGSKWKRAQFELPFVKSIPNALLAKVTPEYCDYLATHPDEILTRSLLRQCMDIWIKSGNSETVRKVLNHPGLALRFVSTGTSFHGFEDELVELLRKRLTNSAFYIPAYVTLPNYIKVEHMQPFIDLTRSKLWPYGVPLKSDITDEDIQALVKSVNQEISERDPVFDDNYFDSEDFMGKWAIPKCLNKWSKQKYSIIHNLNHDLPMSLEKAFDAVWIYENDRILKSTLSFLSELAIGPEVHIQMQYYIWMASPRPFLPQVGQIAKLVKPFLKFLPAIWGKAWHLRPLYRLMDANPSEFWPDHLLESGTEWVKGQLKEVGLSEDEIIEAVKSGKIALNPSLHAMTWYESSLSRLRKLSMQHSLSIRKLCSKRTATAMLKFSLEFEKGPDLGRAQLLKNLPSQISAIAFSANFKMLFMINKCLKPSEILSLITNTKIRNRIALMLHLLPQVASYRGNVRVEKGSIFFRNWVMLHFPAAEGQKIADLKLLNFYFRTRIFGRYERLEITNREETGTSMIFGLLPEPGTEARRSENRIWDLTFEPTGPVIEEVVAVETRKRSREDDENSSNKRQKTEQ